MDAIFDSQMPMNMSAVASSNRIQGPFLCDAVSMYIQPIVLLWTLLLWNRFPALLILTKYFSFSLLLSR
jgi:hypothetical protein